MENTNPAGDPAASARTRPGPRWEAPPAQRRLRLSSPGDVVAVVPHLLGFHPDASLVVIGAGGPRQRVELGFRYDLPDPPEAGQSAAISEHAADVLRRRQLTTVIAVGYGPGRLVTPVADVLAAELRRGGLVLRELMRVEGGRYWSYLCRNLDCCPPEGVPVDPGSHPAAAVMSETGLAVYPDRKALARTLAPVAGADAASMEAATERARRRAARLAGEQGRGRRRLLAEEGRRAVREAVRVYREGGRITDDDRVGWLSVALADVRVRDDAWARMDQRHQAAHLRLWTDLVRRARVPYVPAPAALLAFTAWQAGDGALANIAIERALAADPEYSMALLLRDVIDAGVPPSAARVPMTPDEVEASYRRADRDEGEARPAPSAGGEAGG